MNFGRSFAAGFVKGAATAILFALFCVGAGVAAHASASLFLLGWRLAL